MLPNTNGKLKCLVLEDRQAQKFLVEAYTVCMKKVTPFSYIYINSHRLGSLLLKEARNIKQHN